MARDEVVLPGGLLRSAGRKLVHGLSETIVGMRVFLWVVRAMGPRIAGFRSLPRNVLEMKRDSTTPRVATMGLLGSLAEQGARLETASPLLSDQLGELADIAEDGGLLKRFKGLLLRSAQQARSWGDQLVRGSRGELQAVPAACALELTLPRRAGHPPKDSEGYQVLLAEQEALKMLCKALRLIRYGARRPYAQAAQGLLEEKIEGLAVPVWVLGRKREMIRSRDGEDAEKVREAIANALDIWALKAQGLIRDTYARVPLEGNRPVTSTWLGLANSQERLRNLHRALETIRDGDLPWTTTLTAAKLLDTLFAGISIQHWAQQDRAAVHWLGRADESQKREVAGALELWADEAFRFLDRAVAKYGLGVS